MGSPASQGAASAHAALGINPTTPTIPALSPTSSSAKRAASGKRRSEREAAPEAIAANSELEAQEQTLAAPSAAAQLMAAAKKARTDRTQAAQSAVAKARTDAAVMPSPAAPEMQARGGKARPESSAKMIRRKPGRVVPMTQDADVESRAESEAGSETSPRAPNKKVGTTAPTTKHCTPAATHSPQTTSNHKHTHKARTTHTHTESRVRPRFSDLMITRELTWFSSDENTEDCTYSPQKNQSPTCRKVGTLSADPTLVVCQQNMTNKAMLADESKGDPGHLFYAYIPTYSYRWDHTLGYEGEGHPLHLISLNVNGVLSNDTWAKLLNLAQFLKIDILCLQETNIAVGDARLPALVATAKFYGYKAHLGLKPVGSDRGGTAILVRTDADDVSISSHGFAQSGRTTYVDLTMHSHAVRVLSCYAPSDSKAARTISSD